MIKNSTSRREFVLTCFGRFGFFQPPWSVSVCALVLFIIRRELVVEEVFAEVEPLIVSLLDGYNISILAYGQTGSGKTYSMVRH